MKFSEWLAYEKSGEEKWKKRGGEKFEILPFIHTWTFKAVI